jgi:two-component system chemotaxis sensor kinase CheA
MESSPGQGTGFTITLPLTLAITDALVVTVGSSTFAVPQSTVREVIEIESTAVRVLEGGEIAISRGHVLPIVRLASVLRLDPPPANRHHALVVGAGASAVALLVDRIVGQREIVIRSTAYPLLQVDGVTGATDLGDGRAVLILDVHTMVRGSRLKESA